MNRIVNSDCVDGLRTLDGDSVALTVTSPPYDNCRDFAPFDFEAVAHELFRVTVPGGVVVWVVGDQIVNGSETGTSFRQALFFREVGFLLHHTMIYHPLGCLSQAHNRYGSALQFMLVLSKGKPRVARLIYDKPNKDAGRIRNGRKKCKYREAFRHEGRPTRRWGRREAVWRYAVGGGNTATEKYVFRHPALMPEAMARDHILSWSNAGDLVLDPFMGAGTTAKMAALTGRKYIGFEIEMQFCKLAERRVRDAIIGGLS